MNALTSQDVTVVVITRNRSSILEKCLQHLKAQTDTPGQVLVIDSSDVFSPLEHPGIEHIHFPAGRQQMPLARNEGIKLSRKLIVAFIDDDCLVAADWLAQIVSSYQLRPELVGVGGKIADARWEFDPSKPIGQVDSMGRVTSNFFGDVGQLVEVELLPGGNMSFKRTALLEVGGFDPNFIATNHREDPDLCLRIRKKGGKLGYQGRAQALHLNARNSLGELTRWHEFYLRYSFGRNEAFFLSRHYPRAVVPRWAYDTGVQLSRALRERSLVDLLCTGIQFVAFATGLCSYQIWGGVASQDKRLRQRDCLF